MTRQEIEQKIDELAREYHDIHDPEIPEEMFELARRLRTSEFSRLWSEPEPASILLTTHGRITQALRDLEGRLGASRIPGYEPHNHRVSLHVSRGGH
jgi:hypothetical protein